MLSDMDSLLDGVDGIVKDDLVDVNATILAEAAGKASYLTIKALREAALRRERLPFLQLGVHRDA